MMDGDVDLTYYKSISEDGKFWSVFKSKYTNWHSNEGKEEPKESMGGLE